MACRITQDETPCEMSPACVWINKHGKTVHCEHYFRTISIKELADGKWTQSGDMQGATWAELKIISLAKKIIEQQGM